MARPGTLDLTPNSEIPGVSASTHALGQTFSIGDPGRALPGIQTKLRISQPDDFQEEEADRIAERVLREGNEAEGPDHEASSSPGLASSAGGTIQRNCSGCDGGAPCSDCEEESPKTQSGPRTANAQVQRTSQEVEGSAGRVPRITPEFEASTNTLEGKGQPLPEGIRSTFESGFGRDFRDVRVHSGAEADASSKAVGALAYTLGRNIVFAEGQFAPDTGAGKKLLAHELAHVLQQSSATFGAPPAARASRVSAPLSYLQRAPGSPAVTPADDTQVQKYIDDALSRSGGKVADAWEDLLTIRNKPDQSNCGDESLAYAEHYLLWRMLVGKGVPAAAATVLVVAYSGAKAIKQTIEWLVNKGGFDDLVKWLKGLRMSDACESATPRPGEVKWGMKGILSGEVDFYTGRGLSKKK